MKIAIASDLHLDFADLPEAFFGNPEGADVLLLAGDIVESRRVHKFEHVFARLCSEYSEVFIISGNHEFYMSNLDRSKRDIVEMTEKFPNLWYMDDNAQILSEDVILVGATLWTDYNNGDPLTKHIATSYMNDYKCIRLEKKGYRRMRPNDCHDWHIRTKQYISFVCSEHKDKKVVVMTHHAPSYESIHPNYRGQKYENGFFASDLSDFILDRENIALWVHGHTHCQWSYKIGQCKIECNPRGYPREIGNQYYEQYRPRIIEI